MAGRHRGDPPGWPLLLAWVVALGVALVVIVRGDSIADSGRRPHVVDVAPATSSGCAPRSYVDGGRLWHGCATTPPPAELPATDPFSEE